MGALSLEIKRLQNSRAEERCVTRNISLPLRSPQLRETVESNSFAVDPIDMNSICSLLAAVCDRREWCRLQRPSSLHEHTGLSKDQLAVDTRRNIELTLKDHIPDSLETSCAEEEAWEQISKCCTRRDLGGTLNQQEHIPCVGREQIDEIAELLKLLSTSSAAPDGAQKALCSISSTSDEYLGSSKRLNRSGESTTTKPADARVHQHNAKNQSVNKADVDEAPADLEGGNHRIISRESLACAGPDQNEGNLSSGVRHFQTEVLNHLQSDPSQTRVLRRYRADPSSLSPNSSDDGDREGNERPHSLRASTSIQLRRKSPPDEAAAFSPGSRMISDRVKSIRADDDSQHMSLGIQDKLAHVRGALSGGLTRAATLAFPAVQGLWLARSPSNYDDRDPDSKQPHNNLVSWSPQFSLDSSRAAGWMARGQRFGLDELKQHAPSKTVFDFPSSIRTIARRAHADATKDVADAREAGPTSSLKEAALHAVSEPSASSDCHQAVTAGSKGSPAYFCLLGASVGNERSPSFTRRPLITRPAGMPIHSVANSLGVVSLTGDSLGRKKLWCSVLKTAAETGLAATQRISGMPPPPHQKQLEHVLLLQLLQQQQGMSLPPSALNNTQQVGVCRARNLWIGTVSQGIGFEAPSAAEFVTGELIKELLHRCASSETPLWMQRLDTLTAERYMLDTFKADCWKSCLGQAAKRNMSFAMVRAAVAGQLQQQQPQLGRRGDEDFSRNQSDRNSKASVTSTHAFQGLRRLREHRQLLKRRQLFLSGRASSALGDGLPTLEKRKTPCGFDTLTSGAVACQFLWDSEQQLLLVCHTGDVRAVLAHPERHKKKELTKDYQVDQLDRLAEAPVAAVEQHHHVRSSWSFQNSPAEVDNCFLASSYDCVVLTREHSTVDRDERRRVQGAGKSKTSPYIHPSSCLDRQQACTELLARRLFMLIKVASFTFKRALDPTLGFCFLLVATSSLWKIFTPQEAVDLVVAELWRQQRQLFERQRRMSSKPFSSKPRHTVRDGKSERRTREHMDDSSEHDVGKARGRGHRGTYFPEAQHSRNDHEGELDFEDVKSAAGDDVQPLQSINLQLAADVLENRFCEEWTLQRESEPLADLGLILLALKPNASS
ncbi:hypothetical protein Emed_001018 [Eimeria media]